jgi:hypothetical protein
MGLAESVSLLRQATTLAEVLSCFEDKKASPEATVRPTPNVVFLCQYREQRRQKGLCEGHLR